MAQCDKGKEEEEEEEEENVVVVVGISQLTAP